MGMKDKSCLLQQKRNCWESVLGQRAEETILHTKASLANKFSQRDSAPYLLQGHGWYTPRDPGTVAIPTPPNGSSVYNPDILHLSSLHLSSLSVQVSPPLLIFCLLVCMETSPTPSCEVSEPHNKPAFIL